MSLDKVISAGTTFASVGKVIFSNSNGVTFGADGQTITGSVFTNYQSTGNYLTTAAQSNQVVNSLNGSTGQISLNVGSSLSSSTNGSSITFGLASNITTALQSAGNYLTTAAQSNQVVNSINGDTGTFSFNTGSSLSSSRVGNAITWGLASNITTALQSTGAYLTTAAQSNQVVNSINGDTGAFSFNTGSSLSSSRVGNAITFGLASNITTALQSTGAYLTTARASTDAIGLNTAQTNVTWTVNSSGISLNASGYAGTNTTFGGANISGSITQNSIGLNLSLSVAAPGAANESNWINLLGGQTAGNTTASGSTIGLSGVEITLSGTNNSVINMIGNTFSNSNNITFGKNAGTITASYQEPFQSYFQWGAYVNTSAFTMGGSTNHVQPFILPYNISASYIRIAQSIAIGSTTGATSANVSLTLNNSRSIFVNIYTKGVGASSKSLQRVAGGSVSMVFQVRVEIGAASNNQTVSHNFTYPSSEGGAQGNFATNYNVNSGSYNISTTHLTSFNSFRWFDIPFASSLSAGNYWMAIGESTATATTGGIGAMTNVTYRNSYIAVTQISANVALMGSNSNISTAPWANGLGYWSTNTIGATSSSLSLAGISTVANQPILPFQMIREA
jgi:hypothetical protein